MPDSLQVTLTAFACVFAGAVVGMGIAARLPERLICAETKDVIRAASGMLSLLSALVLGLLISSTKSAFDIKNREVQEFAANLSLLDREMRDYGPETATARPQLRDATATKLQLMWPAPDTTPPVLFDSRLAGKFEAIEDELLGLVPKDAIQKWHQSRALQICTDLDRQRWLLGAQGGSSIQTPFYHVLLFWLIVLFLAYGLYARRNLTTLLALSVCAASIAVAIGLIFEMDTPFGGLIVVPQEPMIHALALMASP
jgi:hypothetical protein